MALDLVGASQTCWLL